MKLIIAEKPSVALAIAKALNIKGSRDGYIENGEYIISWCVGHLAAAAFPEEYDAKYSKWNYADLPIIPDNFKYKIYGDKQKQFKVVKSLMTGKDVSTVINACDAGREGELIFRLVYNMANCKKPIKRLWISSMENAAIREGFENLKDGSEYDNLYYSELCRMWADWIWFCQYHLTHFIRTRIMQRERYDHSRAFFGLPEAVHRWRCRFFCLPSNSYNISRS